MRGGGMGLVFLHQPKTNSAHSIPVYSNLYLDANIISIIASFVKIVAIKYTMIRATGRPTRGGGMGPVFLHLPKTNSAHRIPVFPN